MDSSQNRDDPTWLRRCVSCGDAFGDVQIARTRDFLHKRCVRSWLGLEIKRDAPSGICSGCGMSGARLDPALGDFVHSRCPRSDEKEVDAARSEALSVPAWHKCERCRHTISTEAGQKPDACMCGSRGFKAWKTRLDGPWPPPEPGYVVVVSHLGWQRLKGPGWYEDPSAWVREP